jgi:putative ABC transport system permease protein
VPASQVNGVPTDQVHDARNSGTARRPLTDAAPPPGIVEGLWWPPDYTGPPLVSFDAGSPAGVCLVTPYE